MNEETPVTLKEVTDEEVAATPEVTMEVAPEVDVAPEVAEPDPEATNILGDLEASEMGVLVSMQQQGRAIIQRVGEMEVEKSRILGQLANLESQHQQYLQTIAKRLNIPQGVQWQVTQDAKARKVT
jgi:hypothetical protein